jgi:hypothetical protein
MNWKRGLFRLGVVSGLFWIGYWLWEVHLICQLGMDQPVKCVREVPGLEIVFMFIGIFLPIVALLAGAVLIWIVRGFRR